MIYLLNYKKELIKIIPEENFVSAYYEKEINGLYTCHLECPLFYKTNEGHLFNHKKWFDDAVFIGLFDKQKRFQIYKIHERVVQNEQLSVLGVHLFFDEAKAMDVIRDKRPNNIDAVTAVGLVFQNTGWEVADHDTTDLKSTTFYYVTPTEARKKIIETWNIEMDFGFVFDGKKVLSKELYIKKKLGSYTGKRFVYCNNILTIKQEQDSSEVFTAAIGRGKGEQVGDGYGRRINFADISWSTKGYKKPVNQDFIEITSATAQYGYYDDSLKSMKPRFAVVEFDDIEDKKVLADATYDWLIHNCVPKVSYSTTVAEIGALDLGDEVAIIYKQVGIAKRARVQKIKVNMLNYAASTIDLGDYQYFKQDKVQAKTNKKIEAIKVENEHYVTRLKREFDANYEVQRDYMQQLVAEVETRAEAQVEAAEGRMRETLEAQKQETDSHLNRFENALIPISTELDANKRSIELAASEVKALTNRFDENYRYLTMLDALANQNSAEITKTNAEIQKRVLKTDYDALTGRLQTQLNETTSTANGNKTLITEMKTNVNDLSRWKTEKGQSIDETIDGYQRKVWREDVDALGKLVSKNTADIKVTNSEIAKRVLKTDYDRLTGRLQTQINETESTVNGNKTLITEVQGDVNSLNTWKMAKGQQIDETIDSYQRKIWRDDLDALVYDNENLIAKDDIQSNVKLDLENYNDKGLFIIQTNSGLRDGVYITAEQLEPNTNYTIRYKYQKIDGELVAFGGIANAAFQRSASIFVDGKKGKRISYNYDDSVFVADDNDVHEVVYKFRTPSTLNKADRFGIYPNRGSNIIVTVKVSEFKLEKGVKATSWSPSPKDLARHVATIEQTAGTVKLQSDAIAKDYVKQSAVVVQTDGVLIGSKKYSGKEMASAIAVTPTNVDIITKKMRVTGDMQVAGDIKSLSLNAVYGDISKLRTNVLSANSVTASAIKSDLSMIDKLFSNDAQIGRLTSKSAFIKNIQAIDITAYRMRAKDKTTSVTVEQGKMTIAKSNGDKLVINNDGLRSYNASGALRFRIEDDFVTTGALGTPNETVYLASSREVRAVHYSSIPGTGKVGDYAYTPIRASEFYGNRFSVNHGTPNVQNLYLSPTAGGEVRVTHYETTNLFRPIRALEVYATRVINNAENGTNQNLFLSPTGGGEVIVTAPTSDTAYRTLRCRSVTLHGGDGIRSNVRGSLYIGVGGYELAVTNNDFGGNGNPVYKNVRAKDFIKASSERFKKDIQPWDYSVLDIIKNDVQIYQYKYKDDDSGLFQRGLVLERETPAEFKSGDGINSYEMQTWTLKGVQELASENDLLKQRIEKLEAILNESN
ncbi:hypothetical protein TP70_02385 [Staphylococcus microti]|uniref:Phage protein n=1 Tax=Staphylococcus microti TaxID=569857 RepID=A0A0D6XSS3_9STAP|nr:phage tail spike protein [Staphylococcus microti]KIX91475.1 hypothetical protein TP70_02385 [Staphylococcus microti]PNZ82453.1 hypothetical protein CD132_03935 [Staphylococcus microti]PNZ83638.1 hypothetical protein CD132_01805 [Staphylococcus microti]SUM57061.1 phage protein [Staphylococcus microti]